MRTYKTLAIVDDVHTCDCCGKSNLKSTIAMQRDDGEVLHFGSVCATRHSGREAKVIRKEAATALQQRNDEATAQVRSHRAFSAYQSKMAEAHAMKLVGVPFKTFCQSQYEEFCWVVQCTADAFGLRSSDIHA